MTNPRVPYASPLAVKNKVQGLTDVLDDALSYIVNHDKNLLINQANLDKVFTEGRIDRTKLDQLSRDCDTCIGMMDNAHFTGNQVEDFLDIRNDIFDRLEVEYKHEAKQKLPEKKEQILREGMTAEMKKAINSVPQIKNEIIGSANNYRNGIKTFCKKMDAEINKMKNDNPAVYNEAFFNQLENFMKPYREIAKLGILPKDKPIEAVLKDITSDGNMRNIEEATVQAKQFLAFINKKECKPFAEKVVASDYISNSMQQLTRYPQYLNELSTNLNKIDRESSESRSASYYNDIIKVRPGKVNERIKANETHRKDEVERLVNEKHKQQVKEFDLLKKDIVKQLDVFIEDRDKQQIKLGGNLTPKALNAKLDIVNIKADGSDDSVRQGLEDIGKALNAMRVNQESGLMKSGALRELSEKINKNFSSNELYGQFNQNDKLKLAINKDFQEKVGKTKSDNKLGEIIKRTMGR